MLSNKIGNWPTIGSPIIRATDNLLSVFYLSTSSRLFYTALAFLVIPETLTRLEMRKARRRMDILLKEEETALKQFVGKPRAVARIRSIQEKPVAFLVPLGIFLPFRRPEGKGWDSNLTLVVWSSAFEWLLAVGQFETSEPAIQGSYGFTFQYAQRTFG